MRPGFSVGRLTKLNAISSFFSRVDRVLRRSLGVSETAPTDTTVKPAPPVDPELPTEVDEDLLPPMPADNKPGVQVPDHLKDDVSLHAPLLPFYAHLPFTGQN